jgi:hypothetical protein
MFFGVTPHVLVHNVNLSEWCERYELEPYVTDCLDCGRDMHVNIPFATKNCRGIIAAPCECGSSCVVCQYISLDYGPNSLNSIAFGRIVEPTFLKKTRPILKLIKDE